MLGPTPPLPQGDSALHRWARWVHQQIVSLRTCDTPNSSTQRTTRGVSVVTKPVRNNQGIVIQPFRVDGLEQDVETNVVVIRANKWDGSTEGEQHYIAMPPELSFLVTSETLRGTEITYSAYDVDNQSRTASADGDGEEQYITRPYVENDVIWAVRAPSFVKFEGENVEWIDLNRAARAWMGLEP